MNMHVIPWSRYPLTSADKHSQLHTQLMSAMTMSSNIFKRKWNGKFFVKLRISFLIYSMDILVKSLYKAAGKKLTEEISDKRCMVVITKNNSRRESTENEFVYLWMWSLSSGFLMYSSCFRQNVGNSIFQWEVKVENDPLIEFFFQIIFNQFVKSIYFPLLFSSK